jgi:hypothetical protein
MAQLESLSIGFKSPVPSRDVEWQLRQAPDMTTLPNLRRFEFSGVSAYLEGLVARISAPSLNDIQVNLSNQLSFPVPHLLQFIQTSENLTFSTVLVTFGMLAVSLNADYWKGSPLSLRIMCRHLDWQVASAAQFLGTLSPVLSVVDQVTFTYGMYSRSSEWHNNVDRRQWRELLRPFTNAKVIRAQDDLVSQIFGSLSSDDGEQPLELLPNLEEVEYSEESDARDGLATFLNERQVVGHPVSSRLADPAAFNQSSYL